MTKTNWTSEGVTKAAALIRVVYPDEREAASMLDELAERIQADEKASLSGKDQHEPDCNLNMASIERQLMGCDCKLSVPFQKGRPTAQPVQVDEKCPNCFGYGDNCLAGHSADPRNWHKCETCGGSGKARTAETVAQGEAVPGVLTADVLGSWCNILTHAWMYVQEGNRRQAWLGIEQIEKEMRGWQRKLAAPPTPPKEK
jgi:hypothetical protein